MVAYGVIIDTEAVECITKYTGRIDPIDDRAVLFDHIFHTAEHQSCKKTWEQCDEDSDSGFDTVGQFTGTSDQDPETDTDQTSHKCNEKKLWNIMPKVDMKYLGKVKFQDQDVDEMDTFQYQQITKDHGKLVCRCNTASFSECA